MPCRVRVLNSCNKGEQLLSASKICSVNLSSIVGQRPAPSYVKGAVAVGVNREKKAMPPGASEGLSSPAPSRLCGKYLPIAYGPLPSALSIFRFLAHSILAALLVGRLINHSPQNFVCFLSPTHYSYHHRLSSHILLIRGLAINRKLLFIHLVRTVPQRHHVRDRNS